MRVPKETTDFLYGARDTAWKINTLSNKVSELYKCLGAKGLDTSKETVQTSATDKMADIMAEIVDTQAQIEVLLTMRAKQITDITNVITASCNPLEADILSDYYIRMDAEKDDRERAKKIADKHHYSRSYIYDLKTSGALRVTEYLRNNRNMDVLN